MKIILISTFIKTQIVSSEYHHECDYQFILELKYFGSEQWFMQVPTQANDFLKNLINYVQII